MFAVDQSGRLVTSASLDLSGVSNTHVVDVAASPSGTLAAAITATSDDGRAVGAIVWISKSGAISKIVRTGDFKPMRVCFAGDGTLWALGLARDANFQDLPNHDVLHHYDGQGKLLGTQLRVESLAPFRGHPADNALLAIGGDRIGLYSISAHQWVEVSLTGAVIGHWKISDPPSTDVLLSGAITSAGEVYLGGLRRVANVSEGSQQRSHVLYRVDKAKGILTLIDMEATATALLAGSDQGDLVFYRKVSGERQLVWATPQ